MVKQCECVPIETVHLPRLVKQSLLDLNCYLFPPCDFSIMVKICKQNDIPEEEALRFVMNPHRCETVDRILGSISLVAESLNAANHFCHQQIAFYLSQSVNRGCVFFDCDGDFNPNALIRLGLPRQSLERISVYRLLSWESMLAAIHSAVSNNRGNLFIILTLSSLLRHEDLKIVWKVFQVVSRLLLHLDCIVVHQTATDAERGTKIPCFQRISRKFFSTMKHIVL